MNILDRAITPLILAMDAFSITSDKKALSPETRASPDTPTPRGRRTLRGQDRGRQTKSIVRDY